MHPCNENVASTSNAYNGRRPEPTIADAHKPPVVPALPSEPNYYAYSRGIHLFRVDVGNSSLRERTSNGSLGGHEDIFCLSVWEGGEWGQDIAQDKPSCPVPQ